MMSSFKPKLIALDMDGTILNSKSELTIRTNDALRRAMSLGIKVVIATGRMYPSALPVIQKIGTETPCVFYNGAIVRNPITGATLYEKAIDKGLTWEVLNFYREQDWYLQIYYEDNLYVLDSNDSRCKFYESIAKIKAVSLGEQFWDFGSESTKLLGVASDEILFRDMAERTRAKFSGRLYTATSWGVFVEMVHPDVNKARGVETVANSLGIGFNDVLAIGDAGNDKEMILWAGLGVAMGNAPDAVKASADEVAPDNDHDGVAEILERYLS